MRSLSRAVEQLPRFVRPALPQQRDGQEVREKWVRRVLHPPESRCELGPIRAVVQERQQRAPLREGTTGGISLHARLEDAQRVAQLAVMQAPQPVAPCVRVLARAAGVARRSMARALGSVVVGGLVAVSGVARALSGAPGTGAALFLGGTALALAGALRLRARMRLALHSSRFMEIRVVSPELLPRPGEATGRH